MITNHKKPYNAEWVRCPVCGAKTRDRIREDTILKNYPLYFPKFKQETGPRSILWTKKVERLCCFFQYPPFAAVLDN